MVVCGWLGHSEMAYGQLNMDASLARKAVADLATRLGRPVEDTAQAILDIAVSEMFVEVEKLSSRAGVDLKDFTLMPFGGGGPMLGAFLARELGMSRAAGAAPSGRGLGALGGLVADLRGDFVRTLFAGLSGGRAAATAGSGRHHGAGRAQLACQAGPSRAGRTALLGGHALPRTEL